MKLIHVRSQVSTDVDLVTSLILAIDTSLISKRMSSGHYQNVRDTGSCSFSVQTKTRLLVDQVCMAPAPSQSLTLFALPKV